jgi:hypothetical protein
VTLGLGLSPTILAVLTPGPSRSRRARLAVSRIRDGRRMVKSRRQLPSPSPAGPTKTAAAARGPPRSDGHLDVVNESAYPVQPKTRPLSPRHPGPRAPSQRARPRCLTISRIPWVGFLSLKKEAMGKQISWVVSRFNVSHLYSLYILLDLLNHAGNPAEFPPICFYGPRHTIMYPHTMPYL